MGQTRVDSVRHIRSKLITLSQPFSSRRILAGELIHIAKPIVSHTSLSSLHSVCCSCVRKVQQQAGLNVPFCSKECREQSKYKKREFSFSWEFYNGQGGSQVANYCRDRMHAVLDEELGTITANLNDERIRQNFQDQ